MQPASVDFLIRRGDSEAPQVGLRTEEPATFQRGNLIATGDVARWILTVGSEDRTKTSEPGGGLVQDTDDPGLFSYPLTPAETAALAAGSYPFRIHVVRSDGGEITPLVGNFIVS